MSGRMDRATATLDGFESQQALRMEGPFRWVSKRRRPVEDLRFLTGKGRFVGDIKLPGMKHVALVSSPYPNARIVSIRTEAAERIPGVAAVVTGEELARHTNPLLHYLTLPAVRWYPLAHGQVRYVGEWVAAVVAEDRYTAEDAAELVEVEYEPLPAVVDPERAMEDKSRLVHPDHGSNVFYRRTFRWGSVEEDFAAADDSLSLRVRWHRSSSVPLETFGVVASWDSGTGILDVYASIQMPQYAEQIATALRLPLNSVRVHYDVDVGGSYGVKRGIKQTVLAGYLSRKLGCPVKLIEDRLENMAGGDAHGPDRIFDVSVAFRKDGEITSLKIRTIDDEGAYPGRSPLQLGKPIGAIVGPYRIRSVEYEAIAVCTNKTGQIAVRGFGQSPTNYALEMAVDAVARRLGMDRLEVRRRNFIRAHEFPYTIPSGTIYDSGDYHAVLDLALKAANYSELVRRRDALRAEGRLAGIGIGTCIEPSGGNAIFEPLLNPDNETTTFAESCYLKIDRHGTLVASIGFSSAGQGHETLVSTVVAEAMGRPPEQVRVVRADSLHALPSQTPTGDRMAINLGGAALGAARKLQEKMIRIAAHNLDVPVELLEYRDGDVVERGGRGRRMTWNEIVQIAYRQYHRMPPGMEPGLQALYVLEVPRGGKLPDAQGRVHMYPCHSFAVHIPLIEIDPDTCQLTILDYTIAHDCGTVINPDIVRGMVIGGTVQGIGAAFYERFAYDESGHLLSQTFMDYLLPSIHEVPEFRMVEHVTPSPLTSMGQKGVGEGGYLGAPAALAGAVNDALEPLGIEIRSLPVTPVDLWEALHGRRKGGEHPGQDGTGAARV